MQLSTPMAKEGDPPQPSLHREGEEPAPITDNKEEEEDVQKPEDDPRVKEAEKEPATMVDRWKSWMKRKFDEYTQE